MDVVWTPGKYPRSDQLLVALSEECLFHTVQSR